MSVRIVKNNGASAWTLADTNPNITIPAGQQDDLATNLTAAQLRDSNQLVTDLGNPALSLVLNDGESDLTAADAIRLILGTFPAEQRTSDGVQRVSAEPAEGERITAASPNFCDATTWFHKATEFLGVSLTDSGDRTTFTGSGAPWVDNYHGGYFDEDTRKTEDDVVPRMKVYVQAVEKTEQDPHLGSGGDYTVNYAAGSVTFAAQLSPPQAGAVTADAYSVGTGTGRSRWVVEPPAGKKIKFTGLEVRYSDDLALNDSIQFSRFVSGAPVGAPITFKTLLDLVSQANGAHAQIKPNAGTGWRDLGQNVNVLTFDYSAVEEFSDSANEGFGVQLEHDVELGGSLFQVTLFGLAYAE